MSEFIESIQMWINNLSVNSIIIFIMMCFDFLLFVNGT